MKHISALIIGFAGFAAAFAIAPAFAEDFTAGKTPAQLFRSDCSACHHAPNGLVKERGNVSGLTSFLREHYTTNPDSAAALAAYVSGLASPPKGSTRSNRGERRRSEGGAPATAAAVAEPDGPRGRHRRSAGQPDDAGKRRARDSDVPRPPNGVGAVSPEPAVPAESDAAPRVSQPQEAADPVARLRSYLSSGLDSEGASAQAARTGAPKARKRRPAADETAGAPAAPPRAPPAANAEPETGAPADTPPQGETQ